MGGPRSGAIRENSISRVAVSAYQAQADAVYGNDPAFDWNMGIGNTDTPSQVGDSRRNA